MKPSTEPVGETVAVLVQLLGTAVACIVVIGWAWSLAAGSILGFILLLLLGALFIGPLVAWGMPPVALAIGLLIDGVAAIIRWHRSRA